MKLHTLTLACCFCCCLLSKPIFAQFQQVDSLTYTLQGDEALLISYKINTLPKKAATFVRFVLNEKDTLALSKSLKGDICKIGNARTIKHDWHDITWQFSPADKTLIEQGGIQHLAIIHTPELAQNKGGRTIFSILLPIYGHFGTSKPKASSYILPAALNAGIYASLASSIVFFKKGKTAETNFNLEDAKEFPDLTILQQYQTEYNDYLRNAYISLGASIGGELLNLIWILQKGRRNKKINKSLQCPKKDLSLQILPHSEGVIMGAVYQF